MDAIAGVVANYTPDDVRLWVNSIYLSGFKGDTYLVDLTPSERMENYINSCGMTYIPRLRNPAWHVCVQRFKLLHELFDSELFTRKKYEFGIVTDVKDVVFQEDPSPFLQATDGEDYIFSSECLRYRDEPWGKNNMLESYGMISYSKVCDEVIVNAGVIAGYVEKLSLLFREVFEASLRARTQTPWGGGGPDQAALNLLIKEWIPRDLQRTFDTRYNWAAQCGTTNDPRKDFSKYLTAPPVILKDGKICNSRGHAFKIVHQYDRNPEFKELIESKYRW